MNKGVKELLAVAEAAGPRISPRFALLLVTRQSALVVDVRGAHKLAETGKVQGAVHDSRGILEFRADPDSPYYDPKFRRDRIVIFYCAFGARSALAGMTLKEMGYASVFNLGSFHDWVDSGGGIDRVDGQPGGDEA
jgi:rhodanese-related sulfurtransferase